MDTYILNKSYGGWSAGTAVEIIGTKGDDIGVVITLSGNHTFEVPSDHLTKRRQRSQDVNVNRKTRRLADPEVQAKRIIHEMDKEGVFTG